MTGKDYYEVRGFGIHWTVIASHAGRPFEEVLREARRYAVSENLPWPPQGSRTEGPVLGSAEIRRAAAVLMDTMRNYDGVVSDTRFLRREGNDPHKR